MFKPSAVRRALLALFGFLLLGACSPRALLGEWLPNMSDRIDTAMKRYSINQEAHPEAVCNDGSTPVFYHRPGVGDGAGKWAIWFKGGGSCVDRESCGNRSATLMSSNPWMTDALSELSPKGHSGSKDGKAGGILDPDPSVNPDFFNWNHAYLVYCSSDAWSGNSEYTARDRTIYFRGHHIVDAMFDALGDPDIIGANNLSQATNILLTGSSAGANGLRNNIDRLAQQLSHADVRGVSDAGLVPSVDGDMISLEKEIFQKQYDRWAPILDESCMASGDESWRCMSAVHLVEGGHLTTPMFFHQDQRDQRTKPPTQDVGAAIRDLGASLEGAFIPQAGKHIILNSPRFGSQLVNELTMAEVLGNWYFDREGPSNVVAKGPRAGSH